MGDPVSTPTRVTFVGDVATDLLVRASETETAQSPGEAFAMFDGTHEEWAAFLRTQPDVIGLYPGGSMANAAAAFMRVEGVRPPNFQAVELPHPGLLGPQLGDVAIDRCLTDLKERGVHLAGPLLLTQPTLPGAVITIDSLGRPVSTVAYAGNPAAWQPLPQADILVCRSDHLASVLAESTWNDGLQQLVVLLADDASGSNDLRHIFDAGVPTILFASKAYFGAANVPSLPSGFTTVLTDGPRNVVVTGARGETRTFDTPPAAQVVGALGAGDAYLGGWVAAFSLGSSIEACHQAGARCAATALKTLAAREVGDDPHTARLPRRAAATGLQTNARRDDEDAIWAIHQAPGISVVTGGQTGVETWGAQEAEAHGIPTFVVLPSGGRRDQGEPLSLRKARRFELRSESYQYRSWHTVLAADAVLLLDWHSGEGSAETRRAAAALGRPLLEIGPATSTADVANWLAGNGARSVLLAGNRQSHFETDGFRARQAISSCCAGIVQATALLASGSIPRRLRPVDAVAAAAADWARSIPELTDAATLVTSARDAIRGLNTGDYNRVLSWPGLLAPSARADTQVTPLGAFACQYGFVGQRPLRERDRIGIQYRDAFDSLPTGVLSAIDRMQCDAIDLSGDAEHRISGSEIDIAYDTRSTGRTAAGFGLEFFSATNWETISIIQRRTE